MKVFANQLSAENKARVLREWERMRLRYVHPSWHESEALGNGGVYLSTSGLRVIAEVEFVRNELQEYSLWLHVSFSRRDRVPSYEELTHVKRVFVGDDLKAIMVLPAKAEHYNHHEHCLHLYAPLGRDPLPDFRAEGGGL
jgi:hypothetical protein